MKVNSIAGVTCHVEDLSRAAEFYESIGFRRGKEEADRITFYVNWFFVTLVAHARSSTPRTSLSTAWSSALTSGRRSVQR
jgi:predicted lactoylglutathione lyase